MRVGESPYGANFSAKLVTIDEELREQLDEVRGTLDKGSGLPWHLEASRRFYDQEGMAGPPLTFASNRQAEENTLSVYAVNDLLGEVLSKRN